MLPYLGVFLPSDRGVPHPPPPPPEEEWEFRCGLLLLALAHSSAARFQSVGSPGAADDGRLEPP